MENITSPQWAEAPSRSNNPPLEGGSQSQFFGDAGRGWKYFQQNCG